ncbi:tRNA1(Val) (adenine(37)-N6)-methyltransferase [Devosia ginsengisoli]|uniref:Methyltransferase n=1 Tax=Devosia ginsengisoli TaxID=400770 RepID=A0A5B8LMJ2_9HYPH|nr:methyltransferase [Devosia ginsengisoli]QDZ09448.1 methyltransferase [Devosia ginsengisoli]
MSLDQPKAFVKHQSVTRDAFLGGRLTLSQPGRGFRAGLDSVLLGAAVAEGRKTLLDMGCGVGTAAFVAMTHNAGIAATLADRNADMAALAQTNAADNGFADRARIVIADVAGKGADRREAGLVENGYDSVIANPPFFDDSGGTLASDPGRAGARHMDAAALDLWIKTAAGVAAPGGEVIFIYPAQSLSPLLAGFVRRFGAVTILPLIPRAGESASRVLLRGIKGSRAPLTLLASRALHDAETRAFRPEFDAIFRGTARLVW